MTFNNNTFPFSHYWPKDGPMFPQIDMIIGGDIAWKEFLFLNGSRDWNMTAVVEHELRISWLIVQVKVK